MFRALANVVGQVWNWPNILRICCTPGFDYNIRYKSFYALLDITTKPINRKYNYKLVSRDFGLTALVPPKKKRQKEIFKTLHVRILNSTPTRLASDQDLKKSAAIILSVIMYKFRQSAWRELDCHRSQQIN